jgi:hypothetical protein
MDQPADANAAPANPPFVTLDVRDHADNGDGWTDIEACGKTYSYRFDGGSDQHGNITVHGRGQVQILVKLTAGHGYAIDQVGFTNDPDQQLTSPSHSPNAATILDRNDAPMKDGYYSITVTDTGNNCAVVCDPYISNK